jgi:glycosyltransferase involved in cell wall biosynthesis
MDGAMVWRIITGEYPPARGGVGDYARIVAQGLAAAGDEVEVWTPENGGAAPADEGVTVRRLPGHFGPRALARMSRELRAADGARVLVQYAPHAFGMKAMNLPFCAWLRRHASRGVKIDVMFHEVYFPFLPGHPRRYRALAAATSAMARLAAGAARRAFIATPAWEPRLKPWMRRDGKIIWTPVPSNIDVRDDRDEIADARRRYAHGEGLIVGHFGTCGGEIGSALNRVTPFILSSRAGVSALMIGGDGASWRDAFIAKYPEFATRVVATDVLGAAEASCAISACDVMLQPYPDGVTTRRGSLIATLAHGRAIVTTAGALTEPMWNESQAVEMAPVADIDALGAAADALLDDADRRARMGQAAAALYRDRFDSRHTITALRTF